MSSTTLCLLNFLIRLGSSSKASRKCRSHREHTNFRAWLFRIAHNTFKDHVKKASFRREIPVDSSTLSDHRASVHSNPESSLIEKDIAERVRAGVQGLPENQRLLVLRFYHGFSISDIAGIARCPPGTVKSRLYYALERLRASLGEGMLE